jgi:hypothetical protein
MNIKEGIFENMRERDWRKLLNDKLPNLRFSPNNVMLRTKFVSEKHLGDTEGIILKWILKKYGVRM